MKRKILIILAVLTPALLFIQLRQMTHWHPIPIGNADIGDSDNRLEISSDGKHLAAATDHSLHIFDVENRALTFNREFEGGASSDLSIRAIAFSKSGNEIFVATRFSAASEKGFGKIERFRLDAIKNWAELQRVFHNDNFLDSSVFRATPDGRHLQYDGRLWDLDSGKLISQKLLSASFNALGSPALSLDGSKMRYCLDERNFAEADFNSGATRKIPIQNPKKFEAIEFSRYGDFVFTQLKNGPWVIRDFQTGRKLWNFPPGTSFGKSFAVNNDETRIAISAGRSWQIRDLKTGELLNTISSKTRTSPKISVWSFDDSTIFWQDDDGTLWKQRIQ